MTSIRLCLFFCFWFTILDTANGCRPTIMPSQRTSICVPQGKCSRPFLLSRFNRFCAFGQVCCVLTSRNKNTNFKITSDFRRLLRRQNKPKLSRRYHRHEQEDILRHSLSKRDLPLKVPIYNNGMLNHPIGLFYSYPFPQPNLQQIWLNRYFENRLISPVEDRVNLTNRIINKNESNSPYFFTAAPTLNQDVKPSFANKRPSKDSVVFIEKEYELDDPFAESIKRNFERYLEEERASVIKFGDSDIDDRISRFKYSPGTKSAMFCRDYEKYIENRTSSGIRFHLNDISLNTNKERNSCSFAMPLIVGGIKAQSGEFPHMAGIGFDRGHYIEFLCGGSLISPTFVLTAAHCAKTKWGNPAIVRLGVNNLIRDKGENMDVKEIFIHPEYMAPACYNDIALIQIADGVKLGPNLRPACLPAIDTTADNPKHLVTATGWGRTGYGKFSSPHLLKVTLQIVDKEICEKSFVNDDTSKRLDSGITGNMLCASGYMNPSHDTCQGDSGGPLQSLLPDNECMHQIIGVTSFGKLCGTGLPGVYTRVSAFISWIEDIVWPL